MSPETRLALRMLPFIEKLASSNREAALVRDEARAHFDRQSKPLRDAITAWGRARGIAYCVDWREDVRRWRFKSRDFVLIEVDEVGARVWADGTELIAQKATSRLVKMRLTKLLAGKIASEGRSPRA